MRRSRAPVPAYLAVLGCYLLGALAVTAQLWRHPATVAQAGDIRDVDQFTWFVRNSAAAVSHGRLPSLIATTLNPPHGVNLMWNTSFLLPSVLLTPVTLLSSPQVSLTVALTAGFFLSATSLFLVLRRWDVSIGAAALGGALYGFSPALVNSGIGHYHLELAPLPPLIIDAVLRILAGRGRPVWTGLWLGLLVAAQLFIGEEMLVDTAIAAVVVTVVLVASRPRAVPGRLRQAVTGLGIGALTALVLCLRGLWVQFHGTAVGGGGATTTISYHGQLVTIHALPYAFFTPSAAMLIHTKASAASAAAYPQPQAEYLAYLGVPLIIVLIVAAVWFWRQLPVRIMALTVAFLELCSLGGQGVTVGGVRYPGAALPWHWLQKLPAASSALPDRLAVLAAGGAGVVLAFAVDLARARLAQRSPQPDAVTASAPTPGTVTPDDLTAPLPRVEPLPAGPPSAQPSSAQLPGGQAGSAPWSSAPWPAAQGSAAQRSSAPSTSGAATGPPWPVATRPDGQSPGQPHASRSQAGRPPAGQAVTGTAGTPQPPSRTGRPALLRSWSWVPAVIAVLALLPLIPKPYQVTPVSPVPSGWQAAFASLRLPAGARVLVVPVPSGAIPQPMRWQADTGQPASLIGGTFIAPGAKGRQSRAGRAGQTVTTKYLDALWSQAGSPVAPTSAQLHADLASWQPAAVIAVTTPLTQLGLYLTKEFGKPTVEVGHVLGWRLASPGS